MPGIEAATLRQHRKAETDNLEAWLTALPVGALVTWPGTSGTRAATAVASWDYDDGRRWETTHTSEMTYVWSTRSLAKRLVALGAVPTAVIAYRG